MDLFERIERIMADKSKEVDEEEKEQRGEDPKTKTIGTTKTAWLNFQQIS